MQAARAADEGSRAVDRLSVACEGTPWVRAQHFLQLTRARACCTDVASLLSGVHRGATCELACGVFRTWHILACAVHTALFSGWLADVDSARPPSAC